MKELAKESERWSMIANVSDIFFRWLFEVCLMYVYLLAVCVMLSRLSVSSSHFHCLSILFIPFFLRLFSMRLSNFVLQKHMQLQLFLLHGSASLHHFYSILLSSCWTEPGAAVISRKREVASVLKETKTTGQKGYRRQQDRSLYTNT